MPLLERDTDQKLQAKSVLEHLRKKHPGKYPRRTLRTLQRIHAANGGHQPDAIG